MDKKSGLQVVYFVGILIIVAPIYAQNNMIKLQEADTSHHDTPVICYVGSWSRYRSNEGFFDAPSFQHPKLCTHLIYAFVGLNETTYEVKILDPPAELGADEGGKDGFQNYINLKEKNNRLKVMVAIGGWNEGSVKYSAMASSATTRKAFIDSVVKFMKKYKFDGFDIDWEYPTQRGGNLGDRDNFSLLLKEMRETFNQHNWLLTVALGAGHSILEEAYDIPTITENVHFINIMTYDYHGKWDNETGFNAPLYAGKDGYDVHDNINSTIHHLLKLGSSRQKIALGLAFYGRTFTLDDPKKPYLGAPAHELGPQGPLTKEHNLMSYSEICKELSSKQWIRSRDPIQKVPYASKDKSWISYDDQQSLREKVKFATDNNLFGVMIWSIEMDDLQGRCHDGVPMFLLRTISETLANEMNNTIPDEQPEKPTKKSDKDFSISLHSSVNVWVIFVVWSLYQIQQMIQL